MKNEEEKISMVDNCVDVMWLHDSGNFNKNNQGVSSISIRNKWNYYSCRVGA